MGLCPSQEVEGVNYRFLGIISKNREEWAITDLACLRSSVTIVPFYESLGADVIAFVLNQTELTTICCEAKSYDTIIKLKKDGKTQKLEAVICYDNLSEEKVKAGKDVGLKIYGYQEVVDIGKQHVEVVL